MQGINDCCPAVLDGVIVSVRHFHYEQQLLWPEAVAEPGTHIDIYDVIYSKWYPGQVIEIGEDENSGKVKVTYHGYSSDYNEYIEIGSWRLAPLRTHTQPNRCTREYAKIRMNKFPRTRSVFIPAATVKVKAYSHRSRRHYTTSIMHEPSLTPLPEIADKALSVYASTLCQTHCRHLWKERRIAGSQTVELRSVLLSVVPDLWMMYHVVFDYMGYQNMKSSIVTLTLQSTPWYLVCLSTTEIFE
mmetsp:Transcript_38697/g.61741  ORF Transcript_38697/g.61741 Transcript_38697/m.61741 type:complete len:244 (+) Transcript_38697:81-812(+)